MSGLGRPPNGERPPERVVTPREILRTRELREATRRKEAAEKAKQLQKEEQERQKQEEERRRLSAERRIAGVAETEGFGVEPTDRRSGEVETRRTSGTRQPATTHGSNLPKARPTTGSQPARQQQPARQSQSRPTSQGQSQTRLTAEPQTRDNTTRGQPPQSGTASQRPQISQPSSAPRNGTISSFPHAFERWEQLSSHWEGLTSYWIKRLEGNADEISNQPINQQLARQVTDLSAAGANLFHAVVELQRLRASSERKFQRWFFETRNEQEKSQERIALLERQLKEEREGRAADAQNGSQSAAQIAAQTAAQDSAQKAAKAAADNAVLDKAYQIQKEAESKVREKERELQISRDEARRGWEEIGRMEQAERDRTFSLKRGQPTLVGGVQVVPMAQAGMSRESSRGQPLTSNPPEDDVRSEADTDPFLESGREAVPPVPEIPPSHQTSASSAAAHQARTATTREDQFYQHPSGVALHDEPRATEADQRSFVPSVDDTISEEEYEIDEWGRVRLDNHGNPIPYRRGPASEDSDEYNVADQIRREQMHGAQYLGTHTTNGQTTYSSAPDYSGAGYGSGWESVPRHHHPTRLSDVLEEDERSRTSPSRASERSRGNRY